MAGMNNKVPSPSFNLELSQSSQASQTDFSSLVSPLYCLNGTFEQLTQSRLCTPSTIQSLYIAKSAIDLLINSPENTNIDARIHSLQAQLTALPPPQNDKIHSCIHISTSILLSAATSRTPLSSTASSTTRSLVYALSATNLGENWPGMLGILFYVVLVGSAASQGRRGHELLHSTLGRVTSEMAVSIHDFNAATQPARRFEYLQRVLKRRCDEGRVVIETVLWS